MSRICSTNRHLGTNHVLKQLVLAKEANLVAVSDEAYSVANPDNNTSRDCKAQDLVVLETQVLCGRKHLRLSLR